ncbi:MAG: lyase family protein [Pseudomonadota bacterium]
MRGALIDPIFGDATLRACFDDAALTAAMLQVEAALAQAQAELGIVPQSAAVEIASTCRSADIAARALAQGVARTGVPIPALLAELRGHLSPQAADWVHYGATSQDIVDTAFCLCYRAALTALEATLAEVIDQLQSISEKHRDTVMLARTRGQVATPITFGLRVANWAQPLIALEAELGALRSQVLCVQFGGASGSRSAGGQGAETTRLLGERLGLAEAPPWHSDRNAIRRLANALSRLIAAIAKMGRDLALLSRSEIAEIRLGDVGGSSTMPHKANPVGAEALQSIAAIAVACEAGLAASASHAEERDGAKWPVEWALMPSLFEATGAGLTRAYVLLGTLAVNPDAMQARADAASDVRAEAAVFALAPSLGRAEATKRVKAALSAGRDLSDLLAQSGLANSAEMLGDAAFTAPAAEVAADIFARRKAARRRG